MNGLRRRLIAVLFVATAVPLGLTLWASQALIERSLSLSSTMELDRVSRTLEETARTLYQREREALRDAADRGDGAEKLGPGGDFWDSGAAEKFVVSEDGATLYLLRRAPRGVDRYRRDLHAAGLDKARADHARARQVVAEAGARDLRRGFTYTLWLLAAAPWVAAFVLLVFATRRVSQEAVDAYHRMAEELQRSREKVLYVARLESWQALARKTAHEVKNSLTPIRLMMEELAARRGASGDEEGFEAQAARVIVEEVTGLERRVRAFTEFAAEPPVRLRRLDANAMLEERVAFLRAAHPEVRYRVELDRSEAPAMADEDLLKAVLTNLLENAAQAAGPDGEVLAATVRRGGVVSIEVHDSGPGLSEAARETLFEPTISFKKGGMGLGLSIARKSAVLCGGDLESVDGRLGGAGFRVVLAGHA